MTASSEVVGIYEVNNGTQAEAVYRSCLTSVFYRLVDDRRKQTLS